MNDLPTIGFLSESMPDDRFAWSGILYFMHRALAERTRVVHIGRSLRPPLTKLVGEKLKSRLIPRRFHRWPKPQDDPLTSAEVWGEKLSAEIDEADVDVVFAPVASRLIARLQTNRPIVYASDATVRLLRSYPALDRLSPDEVEAAERLETEAIARCDAAIFASRWAANSAIADYGKPPDNVHVVPMGANLDDPPAADVATMPRSRDRLELLLIGVDWHRKGGDLAVEFVRQLSHRGVEARLTVVGCRPPADAAREVGEVIPFLDKSRSADRERLRAVFLRSHFLLLPSQAECFGCVICEAAAHGVPTIARNVGGVADAVIPPLNGRLLPTDADAERWAEQVVDLWRDEAGYLKLQRSSRETFEERLNWCAWADQTLQIAAATVDST